MDDGAGGLSPDDAFWLLGEETRLAILRAVWAADDGTASFTELRERVGSPDSGAFNYHLNKLRGAFLQPDEDGYRLTQAGREVIRAVMAGTLTQQPEASPEAIDAHCAECGGELVARYDEYGRVECGECGETVMWNEFPPAGLEGRSAREFAVAFDRWTRSRFRLAMDGVCPSCAAGTSTELIESDGDATGGIASLHRCPNCRYEARVPLWGHVMRHPAVVAFFYDAELDVTGLPYWRWRELADAFTEAVVSADPWRATVTVESDGRELELTLDESLDVLDVSRG